MPVMDGIEATRQIRNVRSAVLNHTIPVIAMTAHAMQGDRELCMAAGMNDYVSKPVNPQTLAEALDRWLPREKQGDAALFSPSSPLTPDAALIFDRAGMMDRLMDDMDLAQVVIAAFLEDIPLQITALEGYLAAGDATGAERQAHTIKGASANMGGEGLRGVASHMEKAGKAGDLDAVKSRMSELKTEFERLKRAMMEGM